MGLGEWGSEVLDTKKKELQANYDPGSASGLAWLKNAQFCSALDCIGHSVASFTKDTQQLSLENLGYILLYLKITKFKLYPEPGFVPTMALPSSCSLSRLRSSQFAADTEKWTSN